jgi:hydrogenase-4 component B
MNGGLLLAAFVLLGIGILADVVFGVGRARVRPVPYALALLASGCLLALGIHLVADGSQVLSLGDLFGVGKTTLRLDDLSGLFLTLSFGVGIAVSASAWSWASQGTGPQGRGFAAGYCGVLAATGAVIVAGDAFGFLFAWELLAISFYVLTSASRTSVDEVRASWLTLATAKVSGAFLLFGFLLLSASSGSFALASWRNVPPGTVHTAAYALLVVGFAAKLGIVPLQAWIPVGYGAARGPTRAVMAGVAVNVGAYGLWRTLSLLGRPPIWLVAGVLLVGGLTALLGIAFAGVETRLSRVVAYSSVENAGIIVTAFGIALAGAYTGKLPLEGLGLLAASLQVVSHAIAKSLLFCSVANVEQTYGTDALDQLRGVGRALPVSGAGFAAGALVLAGLPPTIGFVSEWFVLEALMQEFRLPGLVLRLAMAGAGALIALTVGIALLTFLRILGLVFLGTPRSDGRSRFDGGIFGRSGIILMAVACLVLAAVTPLEIRFLARGLSPIVAKALVDQALKSQWVLQPTYAGFSILSPSWLMIVMPTAFILVALAAAALSGRRYFKVRRAPAWHSATPGVAGESSYTAFGFANPLRHVLANILGTRREQALVETSVDVVRGRGPVEYATSVVEPVERYLYRPVRRATLRLARGARRLQSGRLQDYVGYMLIALVVALAVAAGLR